MDNATLVSSAFISKRLVIWVDVRDTWGDGQFSHTYYFRYPIGHNEQLEAITTDNKMDPVTFIQVVDCVSVQYRMFIQVVIINIVVTSANMTSGIKTALITYVDPTQAHSMQNNPCIFFILKHRAYLGPYYIATILVEFVDKHFGKCRNRNRQYWSFFFKYFSADIFSICVSEQ